jgi:hypothetical protein
MVKINSSICLLLVATLILVSGFSVQPTFAQSIPEPAVPQFSIQVVDYSYDTPTTYTTDPYSGQQIAHYGYHVDDIRVEGKIKNQPFSPYTISNPDKTSTSDTLRNIEFYYNISFRGHFGGEWRKLYGTEDDDYIKQNYGHEYTNFNISRYNAIEFREGDKVDVRIQAIIGYETWGYTLSWPYRILNGESSDWSNILTLTISTNSTASDNFATTINGWSYPTLRTPETLPTVTPSPSPTVPELPWLALLPLCLIVLPVALVLKHRRTRA